MESILSRDGGQLLFIAVIRKTLALMETALLLEHVTRSKFHSNFCISASQRLKQINCFILGRPVYSSASDDLLEY